MICVAMPCMPRSGSSMLAGIVARLGVDMGPEGLGLADWRNPAGYHEDWRFSRLHRWMTAAANRGRDDLRARLRLPPDDPRPDAEQAGRYARLVATCELAGRDWGVKDPELTFYLPGLAAAARCEVRLLVPTRPTSEVARSIASAFGRTPAEAMAAATCYRDRLRAAYDAWAGPKLAISYRRCLLDPAGHVAAVAEFLGRPATAAAVESVDPRLRRHRADYG